MKTTIFATTVGSNSGDATIQTDAPGCGRLFTLRYPDGFSETLRSFNNLRQLQNTTISIPIGSTEKRVFVINPGLLSNNPSRCGRLIFGPTGSDGRIAVGSDSVLVTRIDARTWRVQSEAGHDVAYCEDNRRLYSMPVHLVVVSSRDLP